MVNPFANSIKFLKAVNLLASEQGTTLKRLMEELNISRRTAFRLLEALSELGFPLIDIQPMPKVEKTYRLMDSFILKLPNMVIPNPCLSGQEIEMLLSMIDFGIKMQESQSVAMLNGIRQKVMAMTQQGK